MCILGPSVLGFVDPTLPSLHLLAEIGVVLLLFGIGLETDLKRLMSVGGARSPSRSSAWSCRSRAGFGVARGLGLELLPAIVAGAALTATSVGITARVFSDLGQLKSVEGQIVLGAAVIDDVIGLVILAVVSDLVAGNAPSVLGVLRTTAVAFGFLAAALLLGRVVVPPLFALIARTGKEHTLAIDGARARVSARGGASESARRSSSARSRRGSCSRQPSMCTSSSAASSGSRMCSCRSSSSPSARRSTFARSGRADVLIVGVALTAVAIVGKFAAGFAPVWIKARKTLIGVGMIPRGEVGLIFAQTGLAAGVIDAGEYSALMLMVLVTTFIAPPLLRQLISKMAGATRDTDIGAVGEMTTEA